MPNQATAAPTRGTIIDREPLVVTEDEHDTIAWVLSSGYDLAHGATEDAADTLRRSMLAMHAAWVGSIFHTPRFCPDGTVIVKRPDQEQCRALARLLRLLSESARPNAHPTGMVFYVTARDAAKLADRIEGVAR